jgi:ankyrin repeat protein
MTKEEELLDAAYDDDVEKTKSLLATGVAVDSENEDGVTALYEAVRKKSYATAEVLLKAGADTGKHYHKNQYSVLHMAVTDNDQKMTELLVQYMPDINIRDKFGNNALWTAIHQASLAVNAGEIGIVETLLQKRADPYTPNRLGQMVVGKSKTPVGESLSPYDSAVRSKLTDVLALIEKYAPKPA